ncbi:hypothetical protein [Solibacillus sp. CAU 1738]|uniref:hypothetical protein n=1 Tax=Solibacillus sp. CAU 1738 TaxID=3140363 RepID=UPI0032616EC0
MNVFYNIAVYVDDYGVSPPVVYGGNFWLNMAWLRLILLAFITFMSGIMLMRIQKKAD